MQQLSLLPTAPTQKASGLQGSDKFQSSASNVSSSSFEETLGRARRGVERERVAGTADPNQPDATPSSTSRSAHPAPFAENQAEPHGQKALQSEGRSLPPSSESLPLSDAQEIELSSNQAYAIARPSQEEGVFAPPYAESVSLGAHTVIPDASLEPNRSAIISYRTDRSALPSVSDSGGASTSAPSGTAALQTSFSFSVNGEVIADAKPQAVLNDSLSGKNASVSSTNGQSSSAQNLTGEAQPISNGPNSGLAQASSFVSSSLTLSQGAVAQVSQNTGPNSVSPLAGQTPLPIDVNSQVSLTANGTISGLTNGVSTEYALSSGDSNNSAGAMLSAQTSRAASSNQGGVEALQSTGLNQLEQQAIGASVKSASDALVPDPVNEAGAVISPSSRLGGKVSTNGSGFELGNELANSNGNAQNLSSSNNVSLALNQNASSALTSEADLNFKALTELNAAGRVVDSTAAPDADGGDVLLGKLDASGSTAKASEITQAREAQTSRPYVSSIGLPVDDVEWSNQLSQKLMWMNARNIQTAELHLNPADLGPIEVRIQVGADQSSINFNTQNQNVRELLEANIHRLRDMLAEQNNTDLAGGEFDQQGAQQQQAQQQDDARPSISTGHSQDASPTGVETNAVSSSNNGRVDGLVDAFV